MQTDGYMIALKPGRLLEQYFQRDAPPGRDDYLLQLRAAMPGIDPAKYRGISRSPLMAYPCLDQKGINELGAWGCDVRSNAKARFRFRQLIGGIDDSYNAGADEDLLPSQSDAKQVFDLLDESESWEIIRLSRGILDSTSTTLGFDIGYWGGDHFSLIADVIVIPRWHPPALDDFGGLKQALSALNANLLFDSTKAAEEYRVYYTSKLWAETVDEFCLIRVDAIESVERDEKGTL
jgi:hypothetical protein